MKTVVVMGNPNTGKSTLFNALTGLRQKVGNYAGVTVEKKSGQFDLNGQEINLVDVPGTYSLAAHSRDEMVAVDVLAGHMADIGDPDLVVAVVDASNLRRNLFLTSQVLEMGLPTLIALNMGDVADAKGITIDANALSLELGVPVIPASFSKGKGLAELKAAIADSLQNRPVSSLMLLPEARQVATKLAASPLNNDGLDSADIERALIDVDGYAETRVVERGGNELLQQILTHREQLATDQLPLAAREAQARYRWIAEVLAKVQRSEDKGPTVSDRIDRVVSHPLLGTLGFIFVMGVVFQAVFAWAGPIMDFVDGTTGAAAGALGEVLPAGALNSLLTDGVISGVGSVVIFLPQILILFLFIILLEDTGYMARAAFIMDRLMRWCGLSGQSFIPMLSSFACAVPGIMATRVIPNDRDRIATILAAPFMTCSARLPIYTLLISAFIPSENYLGGLVNLQGLVMLGLYLLGMFGGIFTAWLLKRTALRGPTPSFLIELPPYRVPHLKSVLLKLLERGQIFVRRAGTVIFAVSVVVWGLSYFPRNVELTEKYDALVAQAETVEQANEYENRYAAAHLDQSFLGTAGHAIEPVFKPLGWDWKVSAAVLASFPAREVVIAVLGTIYAVGDEVDETSGTLIGNIKSATWPDGSLVFSIPMAIGLMVFYAFCLQCGATVAAMRRETGSWKWPVFAWFYMTGLGYLGAFVAVTIGNAI
jgi:ferrous iron transport protein B